MRLERDVLLLHKSASNELGQRIEFSIPYHEVLWKMDSDYMTRMWGNRVGNPSSPISSQPPRGEEVVSYGQAARHH
jgi:hypothetical protein